MGQRSRMRKGESALGPVEGIVLDLARPRGGTKLKLTLLIELVLFGVYRNENTAPW
jgi:hypothetical protein